MTSRINTTTSELMNYYTSAEEAKKIILNCSLVAAGACAVGSTIPVLAIPAIIVGCFGAVWVMYGKICNKLGISIRENALKLLARAALTNISTNLISVFAIELLSTFIPGIGTVTGSLVSFATVYLAGVMFMELILGMAKKNISFDNVNENELKRAMKNIEVSADDVKDVKNVYAESKASDNNA